MTLELSIGGSVLRAQSPLERQVTPHDPRATSGEKSQLLEAPAANSSVAGYFYYAHFSLIFLSFSVDKQQALAVLSCHDGHGKGG